MQNPITCTNTLPHILSSSAEHSLENPENEKFSAANQIIAPEILIIRQPIRIEFYGDREPLRLHLKFTFSLRDDTGLLAMGKSKSSIDVDNFVLLKLTSRLDKVSLQQIFSRVPLLKYWCFASFPYGYVPPLENDIFAFIKMQLKYWCFASFPYDYVPPLENDNFAIIKMQRK